jgi:ubiquinone/menaquinone biosynthesis C-methylase UbiE
MSRFGDDPRAFFDFVYQDTPPWDIGAAQPAMAALLTEYPPQGPILDVGCGSGDLAIHLAQLGHHVTGIDFVETPITQAQEKMKSLPAHVARLLDFQVADALKPSLLQQKFGAVVDSGFFHLFSPEECDRYVDELPLTLIPGGRYYLHAFDIEFSMPNLPRQVGMDEVRARFTPEKGWHILDLRSTDFHSRVAPPVPATLACIERLSP